MAAKRVTTPADDARFLAMVREGRTYRDISLLSGVSVATVVVAVRRAKARQKQAVEDERPPAPRQPAWVREMVPTFPIRSLFGDFLGAAAPANSCPHHRPFDRGSKFVCMICHASGMDYHPSLQRDPLTDPKIEPKRQAKPAPKPNRRERRQTAA